jgi:hypothetical protein
MIVRDGGGRIQLITQPAHAHLAGAIMRQCVPLQHRPQRRAILQATSEHDSGWTEEDAAPSVDAATGTIADFISIPVPVRHRVWPRAVSRLADDPWAAALVAHHAVSVYERYRSDAGWTRFFAELEESRDAIVRASGMPAADLAADYAFVRLGDLISLAFCTGSRDEQRFGEWTIQLHGSRVVVSPDPFGGTAIPVAIEAREIAGRPFRSDADVRDAVRDAATVMVRGEVTGSRT